MMEEYRVQTIDESRAENRELTVEVPGSKSITNRALLLAALAKGESTLEGVLFSDDSRHLLECMERLGFALQVDEKHCRVTVAGLGGEIPKQGVSLDVGSAGTAARFLTALLGVSDGCWHLDSSGQMRRRPMEPLLKTLRELGAVIDCEGEEGHFPFTVRGSRQSGGKQSRSSASAPVRINIDRSSQFLSALLIAFGSQAGESRVETEGTHGMAYIDMTVRMMEQFGVRVRREAGAFTVMGESGYAARNYRIEPDVSAACYFYAMAPLLGISVTVRHVHFGGLQGDVGFLRLLERMGCKVEDLSEGICVRGPKDGIFRGIAADMSACSDQAITLAAIAPFAATPTTIRGISHIRLQESDRIAGILTELGRMGIVCEELADGIRIYPGTPAPCRVQTYEDHRMAMGFALTGLRARGIVIEDPMCCKKTFETYFDVLDQAVAEIKGEKR